MTSTTTAQNLEVQPGLSSGEMRGTWPESTPSEATNIDGMRISYLD